MNRTEADLTDLFPSPRTDRWGGITAFHNCVEAALPTRSYENAASA